MDLSDLARFSILEIRRWKPSEDGCGEFEVAGSVTDIGQLEVGAGYWLYVVGGFYSPSVDIISLDEERSTAVFNGLAFSKSPKIAVGDAYPVVTEYWNAHIYAAVLDRDRVWTRTLFRAVASFESNVPGHSVRSTPSRPGLGRYYPSTDESKNDGVRVVDGGWDHEHCNICNGHIDEEYPIAYIEDTGVWLCDLCYEAFAVPHDLQFVAKYPTWAR